MPSKGVVWFDALTPKQARLMASIARRVKQALGLEYIITTRKYDYTIDILERIYRVKPIVVGSHGATLLEKLNEDSKRISLLASIISGMDVCALVSYPSPSAVRTAFGLKIKTILLTDSPHVEPVHRLTVPLADYLVASIYIKHSLARYLLPSFTKTVYYNGVDEVEYLKNYVIGATKARRTQYNLYNLRGREYVIVRPPEYKASYYLGRGYPDLEKLASRLAEKGVKVLYLPRYPEQRRKMGEQENVIIPENALDIVPLYYSALAVITGGISMAREAALLGTPAYSVFYQILEVDKALIKMGVPLFYERDINKIIEAVLNLRDNPSMLRNYREKALRLVREMEKPSRIILDILRKIC